jgi:hypothetical protein
LRLRQERAKLHASAFALRDGGQASQEITWLASQRSTP